VDAYLELCFELAGLDAAAVEQACLAGGAIAVTFSDAGDAPVLEPRPGEMRLWGRTQVQALFGPASPALDCLLRLAAALGREPGEIRLRMLADRVWEREWLRDFHARRFGRRLWICPTHEDVAEEDAVLVRLDPGLAFGTGTHASTALCLEWLDAQPVVPSPVIDYGCGSGVLGIAAARLGAAAVHAYDIDPQALEATRQNARRNGVAQRLRVHRAPHALPRRPRLILANILAETLVTLAAWFSARTAPGAQLVLSGLLESQVAEVTAAYATCFDVTLFGARDGWACLVAQRRAP